jgi:hypothetical protein
MPPLASGATAPLWCSDEQPIWCPNEQPEYAMAQASRRAASRPNEALFIARRYHGGIRPTDFVKKPRQFPFSPRSTRVCESRARPPTILGNGSSAAIPGERTRSTNVEGLGLRFSCCRQPRSARVPRDTFARLGAARPGVTLSLGRSAGLWAWGVGCDWLRRAAAPDAGRRIRPILRSVSRRR